MRVRAICLRVNRVCVRFRDRRCSISPFHSKIGIVVLDLKRFKKDIWYLMIIVKVAPVDYYASNVVPGLSLDQASCTDCWGSTRTNTGGGK